LVLKRSRAFIGAWVSVFFLGSQLTLAARGDGGKLLRADKVTLKITVNVYGFSVFFFILFF
jgi:hypothetical protein